jgi:very-short-patch-repair endonuclease
MSKPKRVWKLEVSIIQEYLDRDGASPLKNYDKVTLQTVIDYKCGCGTEHSKRLRSIQKNGAYCSECQVISYNRKQTEAHTKWTPEVKRKALEDMGKKMRFTKMEDWYSVKQKDLEIYNLKSLCMIPKYKGSIPKLIMDVFTDYDWNILFFDRVPRRTYENPENIKLVLDTLMKEKGWTKLEDLYKVSEDDLRRVGGAIFATHPTILSIVKTGYPEYDWKPYLFNFSPIGYWDNFENQKLVIKDLETKFNIKTPIEWINIISNRFLKENNLETLLHDKYNSSCINLITTIYPELKDNLLSFNKLPKNFWKDEENIKYILQKVKKELNIAIPEEWYDISSFDVQRVIGKPFSAYTGLSEAIMKYIEVPQDFVWDKHQFNNKFKSESKLYSFLFEQNIFARKQSYYTWLKDKDSKYRFDAELVDSNIMVELDGDQHFKPVWMWRNTKEIQERDIFKMKRCVENGYSGIRIYQMDVYKDTNNWEKWLIKAIEKCSEFSNPIWIFPKHNLYKVHIQYCIDENIPYIIFE